jgi:non-specific serine/threonine protein kinase
VARNSVARWERGELPIARPEMIDLALVSLDPSTTRQMPTTTNPLAQARKLPQPISSFVGREREMAEVADLLEERRLTTLTGAGGVGKTRLALQVVDQLPPSSACVKAIVELESLSNPALVPAAVATALGMGAQPRQPWVDLLAETIGPRRVILVLDNCEHLLEACATLVDALLTRCPALRVLATSREPLRIGGEAVWRVPSMSLPAHADDCTREQVEGSDSARLFVTRATLAAPAFELTDRNAAAVARLCRRLDGIPLALELAAARIPMLSVAQLADFVDDAMRLLVAGSRVAPPRQQTLRATLEWSWKLLSEAEQVLFRRLSVFADGWTLEAAETVCGGDTVQRQEVLELLARLVDKSLAQSDMHETDSARYRLLETMRQLGAERLTVASETARVRDRHLSWFLDEAERAGADPAEWHVWFPWFYREVDNLRAALDWAIESGNAQSGLRLGAALHPFWAFGTYANEGRVRLEALLALPEALRFPALRAACMVSTGNLIKVCRGDLNAARWFGDQGLALAREAGDARTLHLALRLVGSIAEIQRDYENAASLFQEGIEMARSLGEGWQWELGKSIHLLAWLRGLQGDYAQSRVLLGEAIERLGAVGDRLGVAHDLGYLADIALRQGCRGEARKYARESLDAAVLIGSWPNLARALDVLVRIAAAEGRYDRAVRLAGAVSLLRPRAGTSSTAAGPELLEHASQKLGLARATAMWAEGQAMGMEETVSFALNDVHPVAVQRSTATSPLPGLTKRETQVLELLAHGNSNREIALELVLSIRTVERHIENLYPKIGANGRADATAYALRNSLA